MGEGRIGDGALEGVGPVAFVTELEGELAAVGVRGDHDGARSLGEAGELVQSVHAVDEAVEAEDDDVAVFGIHLDAGNDEKVVPLRKRGGLGVVPEKVVLGEANGVESGGFRSFDELVRGEKAVVGERVGVGVEVDDQVVSCQWPGTGRRDGGH